MKTTFKSFLTESTPPLHELLQPYAIAINQKCKPFVNALNRDKACLLYRGMHGGADMYMSHPINRRPKDSSAVFNALFNTAIQLAHGIKNVREHAIFCTPSYGVSTDYGSPYIIFPMGDFAAIAADSIHDSWADAEEIEQYITDHLYENGIIDRDDVIKTRRDKPMRGPNEAIRRALNDPGRTDIIQHLTTVLGEYVTNFEKSVNDAGLIREAIEGALIEFGSQYADAHNKLPYNGSAHVEYLIYESAGYITVPLKLMTGHGYYVRQVDQTLKELLS